MSFIVSDEPVDVVKESEQLVILSPTMDTVVANLAASSTEPAINDTFSTGSDD